MENPEEPKINLSKTKEYIKEYNKKRYLRDREKLLKQAKILHKCDELCNIEFGKYYKCQHERSKKHQSLLSKVNYIQ
jgi:hypothetical protein